MKRYSEYQFGDMLLCYDLDDSLCMSMTLIPAVMKEQQTEKTYHPEPMIQIHARGDQLPNGYGNGHTLACSPASSALKFVSQKRERNTVITLAADDRGRTVRHRVRWEEGLQALTVSCEFENTGDRPVTLNLLSSVNLSGITPFTPGDASGALFLHRIRSGRGMPCGFAALGSLDPCRSGTSFRSLHWRTGRQASPGRCSWHVPRPGRWKSAGGMTA